MVIQCRCITPSPTSPDSTKEGGIDTVSQLLASWRWVPLSYREESREIEIREQTQFHTTALRWQSFPWTTLIYYSDGARPPDWHTYWADAIRCKALNTSPCSYTRMRYATRTICDLHLRQKLNSFPRCSPPLRAWHPPCHPLELHAPQLLPHKYIYIINLVYTYIHIHTHL